MVTPGLVVGHGAVILEGSVVFGELVTLCLVGGAQTVQVVVAREWESFQRAPVFLQRLERLDAEVDRPPTRREHQDRGVPEPLQVVRVESARLGEARDREGRREGLVYSGGTGMAECVELSLVSSGVHCVLPGDAVIVGGCFAGGLADCSRA